MTAQLTRTNKKTNFTPVAEPSVSRKSEDDTLQEEHPQIDDALQMLPAARDHVRKDPGERHTGEEKVDS